MPDTITIIDDRTGKQVTVPITDNVFPATAVRELDPSLFIYDPAYMQTAACQSAITYLDGEAGILRYRGYPIEQLAEHSTYLEVAYLLLNGELPDAAQLAQWKNDVNSHTFIHENMRKRFVDGFHYDAHPMGMLVSSIAALGTFYNEAKTSATRSTATSRSSGSSPRCRRSRRCATASASACPSSTRTTTSRSRPTS
jgi:citrate synthase